MSSFIWGNTNYLKLWLLLSFKSLGTGHVVTDNRSLTSDMNKGVSPSLQVSSAFVRYALNKFKEEQVIGLSCNGSEYAITVGDVVKGGAQEKIAAVDKQLIDDAASNPFLFYQQNGFGQISGFIGEDMQQWTRDFIALGATEQEANMILIKAMKIAVERNKVSWGYAKAILKDWCNRNLGSITAIEADQASREGKAPSIKSRQAIDREYTAEDGIW